MCASIYHTEEAGDTLRTALYGRRSVSAGDYGFGVYGFGVYGFGLYGFNDAA